MSDDIVEPRGFALDHNDKQSPTWAKLRAHLQAEQARLRAKNDNDLDALATAKVRGAIACLTNLLALETAPAMVADDDPAE